MISFSVSSSDCLKFIPMYYVEKTMLKLQKASQLDLSSTPEESTNTSSSVSVSTVASNEVSMTVNATDTASTGSFSTSGNSQSMIVPKEKQHGNLSVLYMFSRYKASRSDKITSTDDSAMEIEECCSSANTSPSHGLELQEGCIVDPSSPV